MKKVYLLLSLMIIASTAFGAGEISANCVQVPQTVDADQTLYIECSPYTISSSVVISAGKTLTISEGVVVNIADENISMLGVVLLLNQELLLIWVTDLILKLKILVL